MKNFLEFCHLHYIASFLKESWSLDQDEASLDIGFGEILLVLFYITDLQKCDDLQMEEDKMELDGLTKLVFQMCLLEQTLKDLHKLEMEIAKHREACLEGKECLQYPLFVPHDVRLP